MLKYIRAAMGLSRMLDDFIEREPADFMAELARSYLA
jgi:hypothetical protein